MEYKAENSKLNLDIKQAINSAKCRSLKRDVSITCIQNAVTPVWAQLAPSTVAVLTEQYEKLHIAARKFDDSAGSFISIAWQKYLDANAASNKEFLLAIQEIQKTRMSSATSADMQTQQKSEAFFRGFVDTLGAVLAAGAAFGEGYAAGTAARAGSYQPIQRINCTSNQIGSYTYTNCY